MKYLRITYPDIANGKGIRATLWLPGCTHNCIGCHNSWTANYNQGKLFNVDTYIKLLNVLNNEYVSGLTISGGDPLDQSDDVLNELYDIITKLKHDVNHDFDIWIYSGYYKEELTRESQKKILKVCDVLVDGPYIQEKRNIMLPFRGSENQRIWNLKTDTILYDN